MPTILSGRLARDEFKKALIAKIKALQEKHGVSLILAIIQVGDRSDSTAYINAKKRFAADIGVGIRLVQFKEDVVQEEIIAEIQKLNQDKKITGIIVQLPLPKSFDAQMVLDAIDPTKDTDAISLTSVKKWISRQGLPLFPATARGVGELLDFYKISLKEKKVCVIGRSSFVGAPIAELCRAKGALITVCHSKTGDLVKETLAADVIICAVGKAGLITVEHVREGQVIIDVGINDVNVSESGANGAHIGKLEEEIPRRRLVGDVDFEKVSLALGDNGAITPVPGGVGPMTVLALFENLVDCTMI